jgi:hypothetical protein
MLSPVCNWRRISLSLIPSFASSFLAASSVAPASLLPY